jgi:hypothetical protein
MPAVYDSFDDDVSTPMRPQSELLHIVGKDGHPSFKGLKLL